MDGSEDGGIVSMVAADVAVGLAEGAGDGVTLGVTADETLLLGDAAGAGVDWDAAMA